MRQEAVSWWAAISTVKNGGDFRGKSVAVPLYRQKRIGSQVDWVFKTAQPPGKHPFGAYFTTLTAQTKNLAKKLRIPREKLSFVFWFSDSGDLKALEEGRGNFILYSPEDYTVVKDRQVFHGPSDQAPEQEK